MINLSTKKCDECHDVQATYNFPGLKGAKYCNEHKKEGMMNVRKQYCKDNKCTKQPKYNKKGQKVGLYCAEHRKNKMVDVVSKKCKQKDCDVQPFYNYKNKYVGLYCAEHKKKGMIYALSRLCPERSCKERSRYNYKGKKTALYCGNHRKRDMVMMGDKLCKSEWCHVFPRNDMYLGYCYHCFVHIYPDEEISISYRIKEKIVQQDIENMFPETEFTFNKQVKGGYSNRRPDAYKEFDKYVLIVETDENGHAGYDLPCDESRNNELWQDFKNKKLVFIRFNPDSYKNNKGKKIPSPWKKNLKGTKVDPNYELEWEDRLIKLQDKIQYWLDNEPEKTYTVDYLFYDQC